MNLSSAQVVGRSGQRIAETVDREASPAGMVRLRECILWMLPTLFVNDTFLGSAGYNMGMLRLSGAVIFIPGWTTIRSPWRSATHLSLDMDVLAIGTGTNVAIESGDLKLVKGDPKAAVKAVKLSNATFRKTKQNLCWDFLYDGLVMPLAVLDTINPMSAEIAMAVSSLNVVTNSRRPQNVSPEPAYDRQAAGKSQFSLTHVQQRRFEALPKRKMPLPRPA